jgi:predicted dehydrogenase
MNRREFLSSTAAASIAGAGLFTFRESAFGAPQPASKIRVGIIGTGHPHAAGKVAAIRDLSDYFELVGVVEPDAALRKTNGALPEYQGVTWLDEEKLYATKDLQAIVVETKFLDLMPAAARGVEHGLFVHLDKPPGSTADELAKLLAAAERKNVHVQMGYMFRNNPAFELCYRAAREGWLGRIFELSTTMTTVRPAIRRKDLDEPTGGAMFDLGSHVIDSVVTVLGTPEKVTPFGCKLYSEQDEVVDNQLAVLEYSAALATVRTAFVDPFAAERRQFVVCGENGTLEIRPLEPPKVRLSLLAPAGEFAAGVHDVELPPMPGRYHGQLVDFANIILGKAKPEWNAEHDLTVQKVLLEASGMAKS